MALTTARDQELMLGLKEAIDQHLNSLDAMDCMRLAGALRSCDQSVAEGGYSSFTLTAILTNLSTRPKSLIETARASLQVEVLSEMQTMAAESPEVEQMLKQEMEKLEERIIDRKLKDMLPEQTEPGSSPAW